MCGVANEFNIYESPEETAKDRVDRVFLGDERWKGKRAKETRLFFCARLGPINI